FICVRLCFFFQAEDGIRDRNVTGVQTCALPIYPETEVIVTVGGSEAIDLACRGLINPGDEVLCMDPSYVSYTPSIKLAGGIPVPVKLPSVHDFILQPDNIEALITDKTKAIILIYPNNQTGAAATCVESEKL